MAPQVRWDATVPRFGAGTVAAEAFLDEHGFVVIRDALSAPEVATALSLVWDALELLGSGIDRADATTWTNDRWPGQGETGAGLTGVRGDYGLTHSPALWYVRGAPQVKTAFAALWGTDELLTSFDGLALTRPFGLNPEHRPRQVFHYDRGPGPDPGRWNYLQGFVNLIPTTPATGGNVLLAGTHIKYAGLAAEYGGPDSAGPSLSGARLFADHPELFQGTAINPHLEGGDLYLWDDRCLHCGMTPPDQPGAPAAELQRAMVLVCMAPKARAAEGYAENRRLAFAEGVGGGHAAAGTIDVAGAKQSLQESGRWDNFGTFTRVPPPAKLTAAQLALLA